MDTASVPTQYLRSLPEREYAALSAWASTFFPFQREWLFEPADYAISNKARQIGISHSTAGLGVLWGAFHGELTTIISVGELESAEVLEKARIHAEILGQLGSDMARLTRKSGQELRFASGGRVLALPSTGGRSFTGNVFLDEFAYQDHPKKVWDAAAAVTMLGGRLRVASTPNGVGNEFHSLWVKAQQPGFGWTPHEFTLEHAISQGYPVDLKKCWALAKGDARLFDQLFNCKFLDGAAQYIPTALIDAASVDDLYTYEGEYFAGLDIGRTADRTVLVVLRKRPDEQRFLAWVASCKRTDSDALEELVEWCFQVFKPRRLCVDSTGLGAFPAERMQKKHGRQRVEPVVFSQPVKEDLATGLYSAFSEDTLKIAKTTASIRLPRETPRQLLRDIEPKAAERLREDICSIRREITSAGNVRYDAPHTDEGHADSAWALALALHACGKVAGKKHEIAPQSANRGGYSILT